MFDDPARLHDMEARAILAEEERDELRARLDKAKPVLESLVAERQIGSLSFDPDTPIMGHASQQMLLDGIRSVLMDL